MRQTARELGVHRNTISKKLCYLAKKARKQQKEFLKSFCREKNIHLVYWDDLETFEMSKYKPLSITLFVTKNRQILGYRVSQMPSRGKHVKKAHQKYGKRADLRADAWNSICKEMADLLPTSIRICSDENPHYIKPLKTYFPKAKHLPFKSRRARDYGMGELKKGGFDPLFPVNHSSARARDLVKRLSRKTWCTTKKTKALEWHLDIFIAYNNLILTKKD